MSAPDGTDEPVESVSDTNGGRIFAIGSGQSLWGRRPVWLRHTVYWVIAAVLLTVALADDVSGTSGPGITYDGLMFWALMLAVIIGFGVYAIRAEAGRMPAWRTLSRIAVTFTVLISCLAGVLASSRVRVHDGSATPRTLVRYFAWQAAEAVPALRIPDAFGWQRPVTSNDPLVGVATLIVRLFVLAIVVVSIKKIFDRYQGSGSRA